MNANEPDLILNATLADSDSIPDLILDASIVPIANWTRKKRNHYLGKLKLLGTIHVEIASILDRRHAATYGAFFMPEDKYIPASRNKELFVRLALGNVIDTPDIDNNIDNDLIADSIEV